MKNAKVLVTPTSFGKNNPLLRNKLESSVGKVIYNTLGRPLNTVELQEIIPGIDAVIAGLDQITKEVINVANNLKVIARYGVGVDNVDLKAALDQNIVVTNTPGANASSVAELTVGLLLALTRNIPSANSATQSGKWPRLHGVSLEKKVVGLYGFGSIGQQVAKRLIGFDCKLMVFDPFIDYHVVSKFSVKRVSEDEIISKSDILSLHCPANDETKGRVNTEFLSQMPRGSFLINTARGELINETALYEAIKTGHISGAAIDVFNVQPPRPDNPLLSLPQVITTPHMGSHTDIAINNMGWGALENCLAVLEGKSPQNRVI